MHYNTTHQDLNLIDFNKFQNIINNDPNIEFFGESGKEHYKLLSYFSTLFNNANIIDIGTHIGHSAIALSYNTTNTIYTFDIVDKVSSELKQIPNIKFNYDNLFELEGREKWKTLILSSPFIFLDVDPHNGHMELEL